MIKIEDLPQGYLPIVKLQAEQRQKEAEAARKKLQDDEKKVKRREKIKKSIDPYINSMDRY